MSAELKSLYKIGIEKGANLYFIATETNEGILAANLISNYFSKTKNCDSKVEVIEGLQVKDSIRFERVGIKNLIEVLINIAEESQLKDVIFNLTGGFKGVVPYITLAGMIYKKQIAYIFENTDNLISLPPLPIELNFNLIRDYEYKFDKLKNECVVERKEFFKGIDSSTISEFTPFIITEGGYITLSALGEMVLTKYKSMAKPYVMLSKEAYKHFQKIIDKQDKEIILKLLRKIENEGLRANNIHEKMDDCVTDCLVLKEGNTSNRVFFYIEDDIAMVCVICLNHDDYELRLINNRVFRKDFKTFEKFGL